MKGFNRMLLIIPNNMALSAWSLEAVAPSLPFPCWKGSDNETL